MRGKIELVGCAGDLLILIGTKKSRKKSLILHHSQPPPFPVQKQLENFRFVLIQCQMSLKDRFSLDKLKDTLNVVTFNKMQKLFNFIFCVSFSLAAFVLTGFSHESEATIMQSGNRRIV